MTCPRCRTADVHVTAVDRDGAVDLACDDPNCGHRWRHYAHPSVVDEVRDLGAQLAAHLRHRAATPPSLPVARLASRHAAADCSRQIIDLVTPYPSRGGQAQHRAPAPSPGAPPEGPGAATLDQARLDVARDLMAEADMRSAS